MNNEPVAWIVDSVITYSDDIAQGLSEESGKPIIPLYTHPAKTLTDDEIEKVFFEIHGIEPAPSNVFEFARAILRKAQEK
jgi:hypothetical protein